MLLHGMNLQPSLHPEANNNEGPALSFSITG